VASAKDYIDATFVGGRLEALPGPLHTTMPLKLRRRRHWYFGTTHPGILSLFNYLSGREHSPVKLLCVPTRRVSHEKSRESICIKKKLPTVHPVYFRPAPRLDYDHTTLKPHVQTRCMASTTVFPGPVSRGGSLRTCIPLQQMSKAPTTTDVAHTLPAQFSCSLTHHHHAWVDLSKRSFRRDQRTRPTVGRHGDLMRHCAGTTSVYLYNLLPIWMWGFRPRSRS
jgi:hypothetical protein